MAEIGESGELLRSKSVENKLRVIAKSKGGQGRGRPCQSNIAKYVLFCQGIQAGETAQALCERLHIAKNTATAWRETFELEIQDALHAEGIGAAAIAAVLKEMLYDKRCPPNRRYAVDKITALLDMNLAPLGRREPESDAPILLVDFNEREPPQEGQRDSRDHLGTPTRASGADVIK